MKKQATVIVLGMALAAALTSPSFAQGTRHYPVRETQPVVTMGHSGYYDSAVPEGPYTGYSDDATGGLSGDLGTLGH